MGKKLKVKLDKTLEQRQVIVHPSDMSRLQLHFLPRVILRFGLQVCEVSIIFSESINEQEMFVSKEVVEELMIPLFAIYELKYEDNELNLGPNIGLVAAKTLEELDEKVMKLGRYVRKYDDIGGVILAFSNEGIDIEKRTIIGYVFNHTEKKWIKGVYPYPLAIFRRSSLSNEWKWHFQSLLGNKIFNSAKFDKWEMYKWLNVFPELSDFLPDTVLYSSPVDIGEFLEKYQAAYIKPIKGMQGKKVTKIEKETTIIKVQSIVDGEKEEYQFHSQEEANSFLKKSFIPEKFIVQQPLNLKLTNDVIVDFRVIVVKDQTGEWKVYGVVGRNGVIGNIVSNRHRGGKVEIAKTTLTRIFEDEKVVNHYLSKLGEVAINAAVAIERCGMHFGKLGIDLGIDSQGNVWLIEINHRNPNDFVASFAGNKGLVNKIRYANMLYAKRLAGFLPD
ncbi:MAG: YheC/YheD family protein [Anaerobacillus sp.]|uniref:YheC/YheD family endospore coat-associated protein n=1 Tax=Anaerobacillus sp. TaxID=1872506 RepID=UPI00391B47B7